MSEGPAGQGDYPSLADAIVDMSEQIGAQLGGTASIIFGEMILAIALFIVKHEDKENPNAPIEHVLKALPICVAFMKAHNLDASKVRADMAAYFAQTHKM